MARDPEHDDSHGSSSGVDRNGSSRDDTTAAEETPLLQSETSSHTLRGSSPAAAARPESSSADSNAPNQSIGPWRSLIIILGTWVFIFLQASNISGMTTTQSIITEDLQAYESVMWFTSSYLIAMASLAPVAGRLSAIFSPRSLVIPVSLFFASGGIITALAHSFGVFIVGRVLAGLGGAGIMTLSVILVLELTSRRRRGLFIGLVNAGFTIGLSFGAVVYGAVVPLTGWRLLFGIQAPLAIIAGLGVVLSMPKSFSVEGAPKNKSMREKIFGIDYGGAIMLTLTISLFLYGLSGDIQWQPLVFSFFTLLIFIGYEYRVAADPIIPLKVLSSRGILLSCIAQLGFMSARWTLLYFTPIFVLAVRGYSPAVAGSILIPTNFGFGTGGLVIGWLHVRRAGSFWLPCLIGLACFAITLFALSLVGTPDSPPWLFVLIVFLNGWATGATLNYTLAHLLHHSHQGTLFISTSLLGTFRGFGGSFGTAIGGGVFYRILRSTLVEGFESLDGTNKLSPAREELVKRLIGSPAMVFGGGLSDAEQTIAVNSYAGASRGTWQAAAGLTIIVLFIQAGSGWDGPPPVDEPDEADAMAALMENECVGEA